VKERERERENIKNKNSNLSGWSTRLYFLCCFLVG